MSIKQNILAQFKHPHGCLGQLAGYIMANRPSNIERNDWTLELLDLKPTDRVLEVGFGPGIAIEKTNQVINDGLIVGIDHSETMLHQAKKRNAAAIKQGKVELHLADVNSIPSYNQSFDKIYSANVVQFWNNPEMNFARLYDVLATGGKIATTYMPRHRGATNADGQQKANEIMECLKTVGFKNIQLKEKPLKSISVFCVLAEK